MEVNNKKVINNVNIWGSLFTLKRTFICSYLIFMTVSSKIMECIKNINKYCQLSRVNFQNLAKQY